MVFTDRCLGHHKQAPNCVVQVGSTWVFETHSEEFNLDLLTDTLCFFSCDTVCRMALDGIRMPDGCYADGTWELKMHVTDLNRDVSLRVTGEIHIGGVMLKLVEKLGMCTMSFRMFVRCVCANCLERGGRSWFGVFVVMENLKICLTHGEVMELSVVSDYTFCSHALLYP